VHDSLARLPLLLLGLSQFVRESPLASGHRFSIGINDDYQADLSVAGLPAMRSHLVGVPLSYPLLCGAAARRAEEEPEFVALEAELEERVSGESFVLAVFANKDELDTASSHLLIPTPRDYLGRAHGVRLRPLERLEANGPLPGACEPHSVLHGQKVDELRVV